MSRKNRKSNQRRRRVRAKGKKGKKAENEMKRLGMAELRRKRNGKSAVGATKKRRGRPPKDAFTKGRPPIHSNGARSRPAPRRVRAGSRRRQRRDRRPAHSAHRDVALRERDGC